MASQFWQKTIKNPTTLTLLALALSLPLSSCGRNQGEGAEGFEPGGVAGKESFTLVEVGLLPKPEGQGNRDPAVIRPRLRQQALPGPDLINGLTPTRLGPLPGRVVSGSSLRRCRSARQKRNHYPE